MTKKEFLNAISNGKIDVLQIFLDTITDLGVDYCVIGGLAVNSYAEQVVSFHIFIKRHVRRELKNIRILF